MLRLLTYTEVDKKAALTVGTKGGSTKGAGHTTGAAAAVMAVVEAACCKCLLFRVSSLPAVGRKGRGV